MTVVSPCPPLPGPWPIRVITPLGEAFVDRRPLRVGDVEIVVTEQIVDHVYAWELGRRVLPETPSKWR